MQRLDATQESIRISTKVTKSMKEKIDRLNRLIALQQEISLKRNQREVERVCHTIVEGESRRSNEFYRGRTEGNKTVLFETDRDCTGEVLPVRIKSADSFTLHGDIVEAG